MHMVVPIHKSMNLLQLVNYQKIMIGLTCAKLYGAVLEVEINTYQG